MKQIRRSIDIQSIDLLNTIINNQPQTILFNQVIYDNTYNYTNGRLKLNYYQDSTSLYVITYNSNIAIIEASDIINIYINNNLTPIQTKSFSYDNQNIPIHIGIALPNNDNNNILNINEDIEILYLIGEY